MNNEELFNYMKGLMNESPYPPLEERKTIVEALCNAHFDMYGKYPSSKVLGMMANYILIHDIKNKSRYKTRLYEYPFLSNRQLFRRQEMEQRMPASIIDYLYEKYVKRNDNLFRVDREEKHRFKHKNEGEFD